MSNEGSNQQNTFVFESGDRTKLPLAKRTENAYSISIFWILFKVIVMAAFLTLPILMYFHICQAKKAFDSIRDQELTSKSTCILISKWLFFLGVSVSGAIFMDFMFDILMILNNLLHNKGRDLFTLAHIISLKKYFIWTSFGFFSAMSSKLLFKYSSDLIELSMILSLSWEHLLVSTCFCIFFGSLLVLAEKLVIYLISVRFHRQHYKDRIDENDFSYAAVKFLKEQFVQKEESKIVVRLGLTDQTLLPEEIGDRIFDGLRPSSRDFLLIQDFISYFSEEDSERLFRFFDKDDNGDINREEMRLGVKLIYAEREILSNSILENDNTLKNLDKLLLAITSIITIIVFFMVFRINISSFLASFGALFVSFSFIFGTSLSQIFESVIFSFVSHPFDVGDKIFMKNEIYTVLEIGFLTTTLLNNNRIVYIQTFELKSTEIQNIRRSPNQFEVIKLYVEHGTSHEKTEMLQKKLTEFVQANTRDYGSIITVSGFDFVNHLALKVEIYFEYKSNFQDSSLKTTRRNKMMLFIKTCVEDLHINLAPPPG